MVRLLPAVLVSYYGLLYQCSRGSIAAGSAVRNQCSLQCRRFGAADSAAGCAYTYTLTHSLSCRALLQRLLHMVLLLLLLLLLWVTVGSSCGASRLQLQPTQPVLQLLSQLRLVFLQQFCCCSRPAAEPCISRSIQLWPIHQRAIILRDACSCTCRHLCGNMVCTAVSRVVMQQRTCVAAASSDALPDSCCWWRCCCILQLRSWQPCAATICPAWWRPVSETTSSSNCGSSSCSDLLLLQQCGICA
jgi:hypothetical protein